jgi:nitrite reductase (NO-forming)
MVLYALAVSSVMVGGAIGAVLGAGAVSEGFRFEDLRLAHLSLNVLGWASLTIVATLTTLLPTVLRIRMQPWNAVVSGLCLVGGLALLATGLVTRQTPVAGLGAVLYWAGALQVASLAVRGLRAPRKWPAPAAAKHMIAAVAWFVFGTSALAWAGLRGSIETVVPVFEVSLVCGWVLQILLGSWLYLLPMAHPGPPDDRRRWLTAVDVAATAEVAVLNAGLILVTLAAGNRVPAGFGLAGAAASLAVSGFILAKSWAYPAMAGMPSIARRSERMWGA